MKRILVWVLQLSVAALLSTGCSRESTDAAKSAAKDAGDIVKRSAKNAGEKVGEETRAMESSMEHATEDVAITAAVKMKFAKDDTLSVRDINVDTNGGVVTLSGAISSQSKADRAVALAEQVPGVKKVLSRLAVGAR